MEGVRQGHNNDTEGLVNIHGDGDMPHRLRHDTNTRCSTKGLTQVAAKGRSKGLHYSQGRSSYKSSDWQQLTTIASMFYEQMHHFSKQKIMGSCLTLVV